MQTLMQSLYDYDYEQIQCLAESYGWKKFRGHQIFQWLYRNRVDSVDEMTNLSKETREILKRDFMISPLKMIRKQVAHDGTTKHSSADSVFDGPTPPMKESKYQRPDLQLHKPSHRLAG